jgi:hypothetical protein
MPNSMDYSKTLAVNSTEKISGRVSRIKVSEAVWYREPSFEDRSERCMYGHEW